MKNARELFASARAALGVDPITKGAKCGVGWIGCDGKPTYHDAPAVAIVVLVRDGRRYPCCAVHLGIVDGPRPRAHYDADCPHTPNDPPCRIWDVRPLDGEEGR